MHLAHVRVVGVGPFEDLSFPFLGPDGTPRRVTVVLGGGGVGKTTLLSAAATTRPGYTVAQQRQRGARGAPPHVVADWVLGHDDPARPHVLRLSSPNATLEEPEEMATLRRREQAIFDRRAVEGGFVLVVFSGARWFSRAPLLITAPDRTIGRYDVRAVPSFDDATRGDLARETKQALSYAAIAAALGGPPRPEGEPPSPTRRRLQQLDEAMREVVTSLTGLTGHAFLGVDPLTLEPTFSSPHGDVVAFDELPTAVRHLASFGALTVRALFAAYPSRPPREGEAVVVIDDIGLHQEPAVERRLVPTLREALPNVQWLVTTGSPNVALPCEPHEILALRRMPASQRVELYEGELAVVH
jgi:hypothetical protein